MRPHAPPRPRRPWLLGSTLGRRLRARLRGAWRGWRGLPNVRIDAPAILILTEDHRQLYRLTERIEAKILDLQRKGRA